MIMYKVQWVGTCEHSNELMGSVMDKEFLEQMSDYQLLERLWLLQFLKHLLFLKVFKCNIVLNPHTKLEYQLNELITAEFLLSRRECSSGQRD
jgi:hypothetical protein